MPKRKFQISILDISEDCFAFIMSFFVYKMSQWLELKLVCRKFNISSALWARMLHPKIKKFTILHSMSFFLPRIVFLDYMECFEQIDLNWISKKFQSIKTIKFQLIAKQPIIFEETRKFLYNLDVCEMNGCSILKRSPLRQILPSLFNLKELKLYHLNLYAQDVKTLSMFGCLEKLTLSCINFSQNNPSHNGCSNEELAAFQFASLSYLEIYCCTEKLPLVDNIAHYFLHGINNSQTLIIQYTKISLQDARSLMEQCLKLENLIVNHICIIEDEMKIVPLLLTLPKLQYFASSERNLATFAFPQFVKMNRQEICNLSLPIAFNSFANAGCIYRKLK